MYSSVTQAPGENSCSSKKFRINIFINAVTCVDVAQLTVYAQIYSANKQGPLYLNTVCAKCHCLVVPHD